MEKKAIELMPIRTLLVEKIRAGRRRMFGFAKSGWELLKTRENAKGNFLYLTRKTRASVTVFVCPDGPLSIS